MRDIPGIVWIIVGFFVLGLATFVYSQTGPREIPKAVSVWETVETIREDIEYRRERLAAGAVSAVSVPLYDFSVKRLSDVTSPAAAARYLVQVKAPGIVPVERPWIADGMDVGFVDWRPDGNIGDVQLVTIRKTESME